MSNTPGEIRRYPEWSNCDEVTPEDELSDLEKGHVVCLYPGNQAVLETAMSLSRGSALLVVGGNEFSLDDWIDEFSPSELEKSASFENWAAGYDAGS